MALIVVGVGGGIAAYKAANLVRLFTKAGHQVRVIPTEASLQFVGITTWEALSGHPVHTGVFDAGGSDHVEIARHADLIVIAPATADLMARMRAGIANDLLTTTLLASRAPVVLAPAMHTAMWEHAATQDNLATLGNRGVHFIGPTTGDLSSGDHGRGRMVEAEEIAHYALGILTEGEGTRTSELAGVSLVVTAGGTHEAIDPVRFLGNHSTGIQGIAIANRAAACGATVTLIGANIDASHRSKLAPTITYVPVTSARDLQQAVDEHLETTDALVMAAAVADFRPADVAHTKIKKDELTQDAPTITLVRNPDILASVTRSAKRPTVVVGFAAETGSDQEILEYARAKAARKKADLLVLNRVGGGHGFGAVPNTVDILNVHGQIVDHAEGSKDDVARVIVTHIAQLINGEKE